MLSLSFLALFAAGCDGPSRAPLDDAAKALSQCAKLDVFIAPVAQDGSSKYTITDKSVIEGLAKTIDPKLPTSVLRGKYATTTYVSVKAFAQAADTKPVLTFTIVDSKKLVFELDGKSHEAKLPDNELNRRLRKQDFDFQSRKNDEPEAKRR